MTPKISWSGVFPAVTTQFKPNFDLDIDATHKVLKGLVDDVVLESVMLGAVGWIYRMANAFPQEGQTLFRLARAARYQEAKALYSWFILLHLDARPDLVQCIKLCEEIMGCGSSITRPPRLALPDAGKTYVENIMAKAVQNKPSLPDVGLQRAATVNETGRVPAT